MPHLQAEYRDGYIHDERALADVSPYQPGKNVFFDILEKKPEPEHGRLVRLSLLTDGQRHDIDWTELPENARPIRFLHRRLVRNLANGDQEIFLDSIDFGYQYTDNEGRNHQEVKEIT